MGGEFGTSDNAEDDHSSTAQQTEAEQDRPAHLVDPLAAPAGSEEFVTEPSEPSTFDSDVEGTSTEPSPASLERAIRLRSHRAA